MKINKRIPGNGNGTYSYSAFGPISAYFLAQVGSVQSQVPGNQQKDHVAQAAQVVKMAQVVADFIGKAKKSVHIAIYDFQLSGDGEKIVIGVINRAAKAGIEVQIAYNKPKAEKTSAQRGLTGADPAPLGTHERLTSKGYLHPNVELKGVDENLQEAGNQGTISLVEPPAEVENIEHPSNIMHSKYIIRDGEAVLMGSANFTDGAWGLQENNVLIFENAAGLASYYETDFTDLWKSESIKGTGKNDAGVVKVGGVQVTVAFAPGDGSVVTDDIVQAIDNSKKRLLIASMVISSQSVLESIQAAKGRIPQNVKVLIDQTEMNNAVLANWRKSINPASAKKLKFWETVSEGFEGKKSAAYNNGHKDWPHNFMHNKFAVADDVVVTGSFNFSDAAEKNAENLVVVENKELADAYAAYFEGIYQRYGTPQ
jgi:phosphatidylserine/phosphatidylglycerophosphate/cardiolipin synthase-like enzyme